MKTEHAVAAAAGGAGLAGALFLLAKYFIVDKPLKDAGVVSLKYASAAKGTDVIAGKVLLDGAPAPGAGVVVEAVWYNQEGASMGSFNKVEAKTDADGMFSIWKSTIATTMPPPMEYAVDSGWRIRAYKVVPGRPSLQNRVKIRMNPDESIYAEMELR